MASKTQNLTYNGSNVGSEDKRFAQVRTDKSAALSKSDKMYDGMIANSTGDYDKLIDASKDWVDKQTAIQNEKTDFAIKEIEQQKDQTHSDYVKEQSGAYVDWQKQSNQYGVDAEQKASMGMSNTGYSESSQVSMYNTYQNRVATAREAYNRAVLNYENAITEARLQNSSLLAEIAYQGLQEQLKLSLESMQYKNTLLEKKAAAQREIDSEYYDRWKDVLSQINTENALAEEKRQFNESMAFQREQFNWQKEQANKTSGGTISKSSGGSGGSSKSSSSSRNKSQNINKTSSSSNNKAALLKAVDSLGSTGSYETAVRNFMKNNNISDGGQRLLTSAEWNKAKRTGELGSELEYSSYKDYAKNYLKWRIQES